MKRAWRISPGSLGTSLLLHSVLLGIVGVLIWLAPREIGKSPTAMTIFPSDQPEEWIGEPPSELPEAEPENSLVPQLENQIPAADSFQSVPVQIMVGDLVPSPVSVETPKTGNKPTVSRYPFGAVFGEVRGDGPTGIGVGGAVRASIRGMDIEAEKLGVLLDVSGSMTPFIEDTVRQVSRHFPSYELILVEGCCVGWFSKSEDQFAAIKISREDNDAFERIAGKALPENGYASIKKSGTGNVIAAVEYLIRERKCDAVYFLSDFQDSVNEAGVDRLESVLRGRRLYLDSVAESPHEDLVRLARKSGGWVKVK